MYTKENTMTIFGSRRFPGVLLDFGARLEFTLTTSEDFIKIQKIYGGYLIKHPERREEMCGVVVPRRINLLKLSTYTNHGKSECVSLQDIDLSGDVVNGKYQPIVSVSEYNVGSYMIDHVNSKSAWSYAPMWGETPVPDYYYWLTGATLSEQPEDYSYKNDGEIMSTYFNKQHYKLDGQSSLDDVMAGLILRAQRWPDTGPSYFRSYKNDIAFYLLGKGEPETEDKDSSGVTGFMSRLVGDSFHPVVLEAILPTNIYLLGRSSYIKKGLDKYWLCSYFNFPEEKVVSLDMPIDYKDAMSMISGTNVARFINKVEREAFNQSGLAQKYFGKDLKV